jgi:uncharacterized protein (DUF1778 family)
MEHIMTKIDEFPSLVKLEFRRAKAICKRNLAISQFKKGNTTSYAQVETLVIPSVLPKSCGLKPGGSTHKKRPSPLPIRLTAEHKALIQAKAKAAGLSVNEYVRAAVLKSDYKPPQDRELNRHLLELNRELTRQGTNLNQIARQLNAGILTPEQAERQLAVLAPIMIETHTAIRDALSQGRVET